VTIALRRRSLACGVCVGRMPALLQARFAGLPMPLEVLIQSRPVVEPGKRHSSCPVASSGVIIVAAEAS
jgi:hypothetical protein